MTVMTALAWFFYIIGYIFLAACAFAYLDERTGNGFRRWYDEAPRPWILILLWALWPMLLIVFWWSNRGGK